MSEGKSFHILAPASSATSNSRTSDGRNKQTTDGRGPKSLSRRDVSDACELPEVQRSISEQRPIRLHSDLEDDPLRHS